MKITEQQLWEQAQTVVSESPDTVAGCFYVDGEGLPLCVVGHMLSRLGVSSDDLIEADGAPIDNLASEWSSKFTNRAQFALKTWVTDLQLRQDQKHTWSNALEYAANRRHEIAANLERRSDG
jgi:hypothetical protein